MLEWFQAHPAVIGLIVGGSAVIFFVGLVAAPLIACRIPSDYFAHDDRPPSRFAKRHWLLRLALMTIRNLLGGLLFVAGLAMLVLPGQGLLTLLVACMLLDIPGKYRVEKWLVQRRPVHKPIDWLRQRRGLPPLQRAP